MNDAAFPVENFRRALEGEGATLTGDAVVLAKGIALPWRGIDGEAAQVAASAVRAASGLALAVAKARDDRYLSDDGREQAVQAPAAQARAKVDEALGEISRRTDSLRAQHEVALTPPALGEGQTVCEMKDAEIRGLLRGMSQSDASAALAKHPSAALAVLRGPRIGLDGLVEQAERLRLVELRRTDAFANLERSIAWWERAAEIAHAARDALPALARRVKDARP